MHLDLVHALFSRHLSQGDLVVDATLGRGFDAVHLKRCVGSSGILYGFDLQQEALFSAKERLEKEHLFNEGVFLLCQSHDTLMPVLLERAFLGAPPSVTLVKRELIEKMREACHDFEQLSSLWGSLGAASQRTLCQQLKLRAVVYNLGYLPQSDKRLVTQPSSTCSSLWQAMELLEEGGVLCITVYLGHEGGVEEARAVASLLEREAQESRWQVWRASTFFNEESAACAREKKAPPLVYFLKKRRQSMGSSLLGGSSSKEVKISLESSGQEG